MEKMVNDIFRSVHDGLVSMTSKAHELAQVGRLKIDTVTIRYNVDKLFRELGERIYHLATVEKQAPIVSDPMVQSFINRIQELQNQLQEKRRLAHDIFYNEVLKGHESTDTKRPAPASSASPPAATNTASAPAMTTEVTNSSVTTSSEKS